MRSPPVPTVGYWVSAALPTTFLECRGPGAPGCIGGTVEGCEFPNVGRMCAACVEDYFYDGNECTRCPGHAWLVFSLFLLFCVLVTVAALAIGSSVGRTGGALGICVLTCQVAVLISDLPVGWDPTILAVMRVIRVPLTLSMEAAMAECVVGSFGYRARWLSTMALPVGFGTVLVLVYVMGRVRLHFHSGRTKHPRAHVRRVAALTSQVIAAGLLLATLLYLFMVRASVSHFDCTLKADGRWSLDAKPSLSCGSEVATTSTSTTTSSSLNSSVIDESSGEGSWWFAMLPVAAAAITVYGICFPAAAVIAVRRGRHRMRDRVFVRRYGVLFGPYDASRPQQEGWVAAEKFSLAIVSVFVDHVVGFQIAVLLALLVAGLVAHERTRPYRIPRDNALSSVMRWCILSIGLLAALVHAGEFPTTYIGTGILVVFMVIIVLIGGAMILVVTEDLLGSMIVRWSARRFRGERWQVLSRIKVLSARVTHPYGGALLEAWVTSRDVTDRETRAVLRFLRRADWCLAVAAAAQSARHSNSHNSNSNTNGNGDANNSDGDGSGETRATATATTTTDVSRVRPATDPVTLAIVDDMTLRVLDPAAVAPFAGWISLVATACAANGTSSANTTSSSSSSSSSSSRNDSNVNSSDFAVDISDAAATVEAFAAYTRYAEAVRNRSAFGFMRDSIAACFSGGRRGRIGGDIWGNDGGDDPGGRDRKLHSKPGAQIDAGDARALELRDLTVGRGKNPFDHVPRFSSTADAVAALHSVRDVYRTGGDDVEGRALPLEATESGRVRLLAAALYGFGEFNSHTLSLAITGRPRVSPLSAMEQLLVLSMRDPLSNTTRLWALRAALQAHSMDKIDGDGNSDDVGDDDDDDDDDDDNVGAEAHTGEQHAGDDDAGLVSPRGLLPSLVSAWMLKSPGSDPASPKPKSSSAARPTRDGVVATAGPTDAELLAVIGASVKQSSLNRSDSIAAIDDVDLESTSSSLSGDTRSARRLGFVASCVFFFLILIFLMGFLMGFLICKYSFVVPPHLAAAAARARFQPGSP
jgi:hypothetical protein